MRFASAFVAALGALAAVAAVTAAPAAAQSQFKCLAAACGDCAALAECVVCNMTLMRVDDGERYHATTGGWSPTRPAYTTGDRSHNYTRSATRGNEHTRPSYTQTATRAAHTDGERTRTHATDATRAPHTAGASFTTGQRQRRKRQQRANHTGTDGGASYTHSQTRTQSGRTGSGVTSRPPLERSQSQTRAYYDATRPGSSRPHLVHRAPACMPLAFCPRAARVPASTAKRACPPRRDDAQRPTTTTTPPRGGGGDPRLNGHYTLENALLGRLVFKLDGSSIALVRSAPLEGNWTRPVYTRPQHNNATRPHYTQPQHGNATRPHYTRPQQNATRPHYTRPQQNYTRTHGDATAPHTRPQQNYTRTHGDATATHTRPQQNYTRTHGDGTATQTRPQQNYTRTQPDATATNTRPPQTSGQTRTHSDATRVHSGNSTAPHSATATQAPHDGRTTQRQQQQQQFTTGSKKRGVAQQAGNDDGAKRWAGAAFAVLGAEPRHFALDQSSEPWVFKAYDSGCNGARARGRVAKGIVRVGGDGALTLAVRRNCSSAPSSFDERGVRSVTLTRVGGGNSAAAAAAAAGANGTDAAGAAGVDASACEKCTMVYMACRENAGDMDKARCACAQAVIQCTASQGAACPVERAMASCEREAVAGCGCTVRAANEALGDASGVLFSSELADVAGGDGQSPQPDGSNSGSAAVIGGAVAGVLVGLLLLGVCIAALVYVFVLRPREGSSTREMRSRRRESASYRRRPVVRA